MGGVLFALHMFCDNSVLMHSAQHSPLISTLWSFLEVDLCSILLWKGKTEAWRMIMT